MKKLSLFLILLLCSCSWFQKEKTEQTKKLEQVLYWSLYEEPENIDPGLISESAGSDVAWQIYEGLLTKHPKTGELLPGVSTHWEVSADGKTYIFYLRKNAKFSDGSPVRAHDFAWSWKRVLNPITASRYAFILYPIKGAEDYNTGKTKDDSKVGVKALDDFTLQVDLASPTPYFPSLTAFYTYMPVKKETVLKYKEKWVRAEHFVGNGPFVLKAWEPYEKIIFEPNPHYWDAAKVKLKKVVFVLTQDRETMLKKYEAGKVHTVTDIPIPKIPEYKKRVDFHQTTLEWSYFYLLNTKNPALQSKELRQALSLAIDRKAIVDVMRRDDTVGDSLVPDVYSGYEPAKQVKFDPKLAKEKLKAAGFSDTKAFPKLNLIYNSSDIHKLVAELIQQMWKKHLGIDIGIVNLEWKVLVKRYDSRDFEIGRYGWSADYPDPNTFLDLFASWNHQNTTGWSHQKYDDLIVKASKTLNAKKRFSILKEAEAFILEEMPIIPLVHYRKPMLIHPSLRGVYANSSDDHPLKEAYLEE